MRSIVLPFVALFLAGLILCQRPAFGQGRTSGLGGSTFGSGGAGSFGSRNLGGGVSGGTRSFGGGGSLGAGTQIGSNMPTGIGEIQGSERFVRDARAPGQFVGADTGEMERFLGAVQSGAGGPRGAQGGLQGLISAAQSRGNTANRQGNTGGGRNTPSVRTSLRVAFSYTRKSSDQISATVARRLEKSRRIRTLSAVQVHLVDGTATLRGVVATDHDRALAERLTRLEAGIWHVNNELTVAAEPSSAVGDTPTDDPSAYDPSPDTPKEPAAVPAFPPPSPPEPPRLELPRGN